MGRQCRPSRRRRFDETPLTPRPDRRRAGRLRQPPWARRRHRRDPARRHVATATNKDHAAAVTHYPGGIDHPMEPCADCVRSVVVPGCPRALVVARADEESVIYRSAVPGGVTFAPSATKASPLWIRGEAVTCIDDTGTAS